MSTSIPRADDPAVCVWTHHTPLASYWHDILVDGYESSDRHDTPWGAALGYATACIQAGHSREAFRDQMLDPRNELGEVYRRRVDDPAGGCRKRGQAHTERLIDRDWAKAIRYVNANPTPHGRPETHQAIGVIRAAAATRDWPGRSGPRNRIIMNTLLNIADSIPSVTPKVSIRTLCEHTPYRSIQTIANALAALEEAGWITRNRTGADAAEVTTYGLRVPPARVPIVDKRYPSLRVEVMSTYGTPVSSDLGMALGAHAASIHSALDPEVGQSVAELVTRSGISRRTVFRWLPKLAKLGLARHSPKHGWLRGDTDPGFVASDYDVPDKVMEREARHKLQREGFHAWREARDGAVGKQADRRQQNVEAVEERRREAVKVAESTTPPKVTRRGPETRAAAVNPEAWEEMQERWSQRL